MKLIHKEYPCSLESLVTENPKFPSALSSGFFWITTSGFMILGNLITRDISAPWNPWWPKFQKGLSRLLPKRNFGFRDFTDPNACSLTLQLPKYEFPKYQILELHKSSVPSLHSSSPQLSKRRNVEISWRSINGSQWSLGSLWVIDRTLGYFSISTFWKLGARRVKGQDAWLVKSRSLVFRHFGIPVTWGSKGQRYPL